MALDGTEVRKGLSGHLYRAPLGTAMPADLSTGMTADWIELGYGSTDGVTFTPNWSTDDVNAWQSLVPVRTDVTAATFEAGFKLLQRNSDTLPVAMGGGTITEVGTGSGVYKFVPPAAADGLTEAAWVFEVIDGDITDRYCLERGVVKDPKAFTVSRSDPTQFEVTVSALAPSSGDSPWYLISNDANMAPAT